MNRTSVITALLVFSLVACDLLKKKDVDAGADTGTTVAVAPTQTADAADPGPAATLEAAPTAAAGGTKVVAKPTDGGSVADSGAASSGDGGVASAKLDGGAAPETCCCKVAGKLSQSPQSECTTSMKGACVKKAECEAKSCCCKIGDAKSKRMQAECSFLKGSCVKKEECK